MGFLAWIAALLFLAIAALRYWAAYALNRRIASVPPSRRRAAHLIVLSTLCMCSWEQNSP
jgi:protein-S-isoprenylcysteine O-methyltransferase Ste14